MAVRTTCPHNREHPKLRIMDGDLTEVSSLGGATPMIDIRLFG